MSSVLPAESNLQQPNEPNKAYHHPGLHAVNHVMAALPKARILDLGCPSAASFNYYKNNNCHIRFENLSDFLTSSINNKLHLDNDRFISELENYLSILDPKDRFDAILCWDVFCYLDESTTTYLSQKLRSYCKTDTIVHMIRYWNGQFPQTPCEFQVIAGEQASNSFDSSQLRQHLKLPSATRLLKMMPGYTLQHHFVQEQGMHPSMTEVLFSVRPSVNELDTPTPNIPSKDEALDFVKPQPKIVHTPAKAKKSLLEERKNHKSPLLPNIFGGQALIKRKSGSFNVLDLGAQTKDNAKFYGYFASEVAFLNAPQLLKNNKLPTFASIGKAPFVASQTQFDIVMGWDILCCSSREQVSAIMGLLKPYLKGDAKMHLVRYSGSDPHFKIRHHNILSPRYLELIGEDMPQPLNRLSMIQLVSAIGFGNIEQSSMFLPEMLPNVSEYLLRFNI